MQFKPSKLEASLLQLQGMPGYILADRPIVVEQYVSNYTSTLEGLKPLSVKKKQQLDDYEKVLTDPCATPYIMCVSSEPNDMAAKRVAASIMLSAHRQGFLAHWHTLIGGYRDDMRDKPVLYKKNELLIFSNVPAGSTDNKFEKLRDLLEMFSKVPRIVVTTGCEPVRFFNELGLPVHYPMWIRSSRTIRVLNQSE